MACCEDVIPEEISFGLTSGVWGGVCEDYPTSGTLFSLGSCIWSNTIDDIEFRLEITDSEWIFTVHNGEYQVAIYSFATEEDCCVDSMVLPVQCNDTTPCGEDAVFEVVVSGVTGPGSPCDDGTINTTYTMVFIGGQIWAVTVGSWTATLDLSFGTGATLTINHSGGTVNGFSTECFNCETGGELANFFISFDSCAFSPSTLTVTRVGGVSACESPDFVELSADCSPNSSSSSSSSSTFCCGTVRLSLSCTNGLYSLIGISPGGTSATATATTTCNPFNLNFSDVICLGTVILTNSSSSSSSSDIDDGIETTCCEEPTPRNLCAVIEVVEGCCCIDGTYPIIYDDTLGIDGGTWTTGFITDRCFSDVDFKLKFSCNDETDEWNLETGTGFAKPDPTPTSFTCSPFTLVFNDVIAAGAQCGHVGIDGTVNITITEDSPCVMSDPATCTICCPDITMPSVLYADVDSGPCSGTYTLTWDGSAWSNLSVGGCEKIVVYCYDIGFGFTWNVDTFASSNPTGVLTSCSPFLLEATGIVFGDCCSSTVTINVTE